VVRVTGMAFGWIVATGRACRSAIAALGTQSARAVGAPPWGCRERSCSGRNEFLGIGWLSCLLLWGSLRYWPRLRASQSGARRAPEPGW
jgi:hypothetical protein